MALRHDIWEIVQRIVGGTVIWANQNGSRPQPPYTVLNISARRGVHVDHHGSVDANGIMPVQGNREMTLSIQAHGPGSMEKLEQLFDKLHTVTVLEHLEQHGIAIANEEAVTDISALLGNVDVEQRAGLDVMIRIRSEVLDDVGLIETVNLRGRDDGTNSSVYDLNLTLVANDLP